MHTSPHRCSRCVVSTHLFILYRVLLLKMSLLKAKLIICFHLIVRVAGYWSTSRWGICSHHLYSSVLLLRSSTSNKSGDLQTNRPRPSRTNSWSSSSSSSRTKSSSSSGSSSNNSNNSTRSRMEARVRFRNADEMIDSLRSNDSVGMLLFTSLHCGPCRLQKLEMQQFLQRRQQEKQRGRAAVPIKIFTIETEKWPAVCKRFQVSKLPSMVLMDGDHVVQRLEGLVSAQDLWEHVQKSRASKE